MIPDANVLLVRWISQLLNTNRISATVLPEWQPVTQDGFRPQDGPWIVISRSGGIIHPEAPILHTRVQVRVWADVNQFQEASALSSQICEAIHGQTHVDLATDGWITYCTQQEGDQDVIDPDTAYATVLSFYEVCCRSGG